MIKPEESLLLVIDLQEKFVPDLVHSKRVLQYAEVLLRAAKALNIPVVVSEHHPEAIGPTVDVIAGRLEGAKIYRKDIFGCFGDEAIKSAITSAAGVKNIIITGCETHICVMQTSLAALELGYNVHVAANAVSSRTDLDWKLGLERIGKAGGVIASAEMTVYELLRRSDTAEFKQLLPVFKEWKKREP